MKKVVLSLILFCAIALPALGELTEADLNKIRLIIKEEIKTELESFEKDIDKRLSLITILVGGLIALIVLAVGIPQILIAWRSRTDRIQSRDVISEPVIEQMTVNRRLLEALIRDQEKKIEVLTQEIETLKEQQTVNP